MISQAVTIGGIPIPSSAPWFLAVVGVHVVAGVIAVGAGVVAMLCPKKPGRHPRMGTTYFWALVVVTVTMGALAAAQWPADNHLLVLGVGALGCATAGRRARRHDRLGWRRVHIVLMGLSFILLLTAFYVDNGPHLPLWNRLPMVAFWLLPAAIGGPIIVRALRAHGALNR